MPDYDVIVVGAIMQLSGPFRRERRRKSRGAEKAHKGMREEILTGVAIFRMAFDKADLKPFLPGVEEKYLNFYDGIEPYTKERFWSDLNRVTQNRTDKELAEVLIDNSYDTVKWATEIAEIPCEPATSVCGIKVNGQWTFPGGVVVRAVHEGVGLSSCWFAAAEQAGIEIRYGSGATELVQDKNGRVTGVVTKEDDESKTITAKAIILACGGFEANAQWRAQYLGAPWDHAKVRGSSYNQGDGLRMALAIGALPWGQWRPSLNSN